MWGIPLALLQTKLHVKSAGLCEEGGGGEWMKDVAHQRVGSSLVPK